MKNFDIAKIAASGQCFRFKKIPGKPGVYSVVANGNYAEVTNEPDGTTIWTNDTTKNNDFWKEYFDVNTDYSKIIESIDPADHFLTAAAEYGAGIRILQQDIWEMLVTWQLSPCNTITNITAVIENICEKYGETGITDNGTVFKKFPDPERLTDAEGLRKCKAGFRAERIAKMAQNVVNGKIDLAALKNMEPDRVHNYLTAIEGIGDKVANCIRLYGLHDMRAFPVDTWIDKVIRVKYNGVFPMERYQEAAGVIQQYIYYYGRTLPELQGKRGK